MTVDSVPFTANFERKAIEVGNDSRRAKVVKVETNCRVALGSEFIDYNQCVRIFRGGNDDYICNVIAHEC